MRCTSQSLRLVVVILGDTWYSLGSPGHFLSRSCGKLQVSGHIQTMIPGRPSIKNHATHAELQLIAARYACFECAPPAVVASGGDENAIKREASPSMTTRCFPPSTAVAQ